MHRPSRGGNSGRFSDPLLSTGCTPLLRATMGNDMEVVKALLAKGASPNINDLGLTPFLVAAGVGTSGRGGGLAGSPGANSTANMALMDLLLEHGADVNAQVTGTKTWSMRISRAPSTNEGFTALHAAAQSGRTDLVRYLLDKGANPEIVDSNARKPIDLVGSLATGNAPAATGNAAASTTPPVAGTPPSAGARDRGGLGVAGGAANAAEIRAMLQNAALRK
jgi:ankyrin repeat protein